jgi:xanthine/uracil permease
VFTITSIETVGDTAATEEASFLSTTGPSHERRIRGALLNDGIGGVFSALATSLPLTTFAQNNGVISLTAVASRQAGWACAVWLFVLGVIAKFAAVITTIPDCVFGGMTTFLFANVISSGIKIVVGERPSA